VVNQVLHSLHVGRHHGKSDGIRLKYGRAQGLSQGGLDIHIEALQEAHDVRLIQRATELHYVAEAEARDELLQPTALRTVTSDPE
jgi:hypothetical protein